MKIWRESVLAAGELLYRLQFLAKQYAGKHGKSSYGASAPLIQFLLSAVSSQLCSERKFTISDAHRFTGLVRDVTDDKELHAALGSPGANDIVAVLDRYYPWAKRLDWVAKQLLKNSADWYHFTSSNPTKLAPLAAVDLAFQKSKKPPEDFGQCLSILQDVVEAEDLKAAYQDRLHTSGKEIARLSDGWRVVELTTVQELTDEGTFMHNCVGSADHYNVYTVNGVSCIVRSVIDITDAKDDDDDGVGVLRAMLKGSCRVFSVRNALGVPKIDIAIKLNDNDELEALARYNKPPVEFAAQLAEARQAISELPVDHAARIALAAALKSAEEAFLKRLPGEQVRFYANRYKSVSLMFGTELLTFSIATAEPVMQFVRTDLQEYKPENAGHTARKSIIDISRPAPTSSPEVDVYLLSRDETYYLHIQSGPGQHSCWVVYPNGWTPSQMAGRLGADSLNDVYVRVVDFVNVVALLTNLQDSPPWDSVFAGVDIRGNGEQTIVLPLITFEDSSLQKCTFREGVEVYNSTLVDCVVQYCLTADSSTIRNSTLIRMEFPSDLSVGVQTRDVKFAGCTFKGVYFTRVCPDVTFEDCKFSDCTADESFRPLLGQQPGLVYSE